MEFAIMLSRERPDPFPVEVSRRHVARLRQLDDEHRLVACGPLADGTGGLILASFDSVEAAERYAAEDPYVTEGYVSAEVHPWLWARRDNGYLFPPD